MVFVRITNPISQPLWTRKPFSFLHLHDLFLTMAFLFLFCDIKLLLLQYREVSFLLVLDSAYTEFSQSFTSFCGAFFKINTSFYGAGRSRVHYHISI